MKIPLFYALILAVLVSNLSISVPEVLTKSMGLLSQATIPLLIFILGLQLSNIKVKFIYLKIISLAVVVRLAVSPAIAYPLLGFLGITGIEQQIAAIQTSTPAALLPLLYAIRFNRVPDLLAAIILTTTLLSGISLTVLIRLLN